jgi:hypothetical protein
MPELTLSIGFARVKISQRTRRLSNVSPVPVGSRGAGRANDCWRFFCPDVPQRAQFDNVY